MKKIARLVFRTRHGRAVEWLYMRYLDETYCGLCARDWIEAWAALRLW